MVEALDLFLRRIFRRLPCHTWPVLENPRLCLVSQSMSLKQPCPALATFLNQAANATTNTSRTLEPRYRGDAMFADSFATNSLPKAQQLEAWRCWYDTIFDVTPSRSDDDGFVAVNSTWSVQGLTISRVASPANTVSRTKSVIRHNSVDHWVITLSKQSVSEVATRGISFEAPPGTPFILSFGEEIGIRRREQSASSSFWRATLSRPLRRLSTPHEESH